MKASGRKGWQLFAYLKIHVAISKENFIWWINIGAENRVIMAQEKRVIMAQEKRVIMAQEKKVNMAQEIWVIMAQVKRVIMLCYIVCKLPCWNVVNKWGSVYTSN